MVLNNGTGATLDGEDVGNLEDDIYPKAVSVGHVMVECANGVATTQ